jgi:hypothetical protein
MNAHTHPEEARALRSSRQRVAELLATYPDISRREKAEIVSFMRTGRHLDIGLLTSNVSLRPKLDAFMADHKHHFRIGLGEGAAVTAVVSAVLVVLALLWEVLTPVAA